MTRRLRQSIVLTLLLAFACSLLLAGTARAEPCLDCDPGGDPDPLTLAVSLTLGATPTYGSDLQASVSTDKPEMDGSVSIAWERTGFPDVTVASGAEGDFDIPTATRFKPGQTYYLRAHADKLDGSSGASVRVGFTVDPITSALEFLTTQPNPGGPVQVRVNAATPTSQVPTGTMTLSVDGTAIGNATLDGQGVASFPGIQPGRYPNTVASYAGDGIFTPGTAAATIQTYPYASGYAADLSAGSITQGDPVSVHVTPSGGVAQHPAAGTWHLLAGHPGDDQSVIAEGASDGSTPFDVDLTEWARTHVGTWSLSLNYDGNAWVNGSFNTGFAQLTVAKHRMATLTELSVPATVAPGAAVTTRVTSTEPTGPVTGVVGVYDGTRLLATGQVGADGTTRLTLPATLGAGRPTLHAPYAGSADHLPSTSAAVTVDVRSTTTTASKSRSVVGGSVRVARRTVRLTVVVTGAASPTGTVQIRDGKRVIKTVSLSGGRAVVRLKRLKKGRHVLTATYLGSATLLAAEHRWSVRIR